MVTLIATVSNSVSDMAKKRKGKQVRANFRKRQNTRVRKTDFTREFEVDAEQLGDQRTDERVSGKGHLTRKRTIAGSDAESEASGDSKSI